MAKTPAPSGLSISRKGEKFTFSWKTHSYSAQDVQFKVGGYTTTKKVKKGNKTTTKKYNPYASWTNIKNVGKNTTSKSKKIDFDKGISWISFRVRGKKKKKWSGWSQKTYDVKIPKAPTVGTKLNSEFSTTFAWSIPSDNTSSEIFTDYKWESTLIKDCTTKDGSKVSWKNIDKSGTGTKSSGSWTKEETGWVDTIKSSYSYTRWFRIRAHGPQGWSVKKKGKTTYDYVYAYHTYARSNRVLNTEARLIPRSDGSSGYMLNISWTTPVSVAHPVDKVNVNYKIVTPDSEIVEQDGQMVTTIYCPDGTESWTKFNQLGGLKGRRALTIPISSPMPPNKALYVRVDTVHDSDDATVEGEPTLAIQGLSSLSKPTNVRIDQSDISQRRITVSVEHTCDITASFVALYFRSTSQPVNDRVIGIIPHSSTSVVVQLPEWPEGDNISIGARTCLADYSPVAPSSSFPTEYFVTNIKSQSDIEWSEGVPLPPSDVVVTKATSTSAQISWKWSWAEATGAELSWSTNKDAWESTDAPSTFEVENIHASKWTITGLSTGLWYVRIRLYNKTNDKTVYGTYSDIFEVKLSETPDTPALEVTPEVVTKNGSITCTWSYVSNDGTLQQQADIAEVDLSGDEPVYSEPIAHAGSTQRLTIYPSQQNPPWESGETHNLVVRVTSGSGESSNGWSAPVAVKVADKVTSTITETSLTYVDVPIDTDIEPETISGDILTYDNDSDAREIKSLVISIEPEISGRTDVVTQRTGVNVWDEEWELGIWDTSNGQKANNSTNIRSKSFIPIAPNTQYCWNNSVSNVIRFCFYDANKQFLQNMINAQNSPWVFTTPQNARYMTFYYGATTYEGTLSINYPSTDTDYHAYDGTTYITDLGQTVYGGKLDVVSGELTVDRAMVDLGSLSAVYNSTWQCWYLASGISGANVVGSNNDAPSAISDRMTAVKASGYTSSHSTGTFSQNTSGAWFFDNGSETQLNGTLVYELAEPQTYQLTPQQVELLLGQNNIWSDSGASTAIFGSEQRRDLSLIEYPLTAKAEGAGEGGQTMYVVQRAEDYPIDRPDETEFEGFENETVAFVTTEGERSVDIYQTDLIGNDASSDNYKSKPKAYMDDGALYKLIAISTDSFGQSAESEPVIFRVHWEHQAIKPTAEVEVDQEHHITMIKPIQPTEGYEDGDTCDIYRLSADKPELIYADASFGTTYVDPYPTLGDFGGHRIVYKTYNGDYIDANNEFAWEDYTAEDDPQYRHNLFGLVIDFNGSQLILPYDVSVSNSWSKDFIETKYLGGSVRGDWNPAVSRSGSLSSNIPVQFDAANIELLRRLAVYPGACHIRTPDGSSFTANVDVKEDRDDKMINKLAKASLDITKIDPEGYDAVTLEDWIRNNNE